jgi:hypothetical protein
VKVYLGGPMRGHDNYNFNEFSKGEAYLKWLGHDVVSPHTIDIDEGYVSVAFVQVYHGPTEQWYDHFYDVKLTDEFRVEKALQRDIREILDCDAIALLPGWSSSEGARLEFQVAVGIGLYVYYVDPFEEFRIMNLKETHAVHQG